MSALLLGHRGNPAAHAENTLPGFLDAVACGADGVELDVHLTRDGVPVVVHDDTLLRTAGRDVRVGALSWQELGGLHAAVPRLDAVLHALHDHVVAVELKPPHAAQPDLARIALDCIREAAADRAMLLAFDHAHLAAARRLDPRIACAALVRERPADPVAVLAACGAAALACWWEAIDAELCEVVRQAGREVFAWTVDDEAAARRLLDSGVAALISNRPCDLVAALRRRRED